MAAKPDAVSLLQEVSAKLDTLASMLEPLAGIPDAIVSAMPDPPEPDPPTQPTWGWRLVETTGTAVILGNADIQAVVVQALPSNGANVVIGNQSIGRALGYPLAPGQQVGVYVDNLYQLSVNGTAGDGVAWIGS